MPSRPILDILDWIASNRLGGVACGDQKECVADLLGPPSTCLFLPDDARGFDAWMTSERWSYDNWKLGFEENTLQWIFYSPMTDAQPGWRINESEPQYTIAPFDPSLIEHIDCAERILKDRGIRCERVGHYYKICSTETCEVRKIRRRTSHKTMFAGKNMQTCFRFHPKTDKLFMIMQPFIIRRQVFDFGKMENSWEFLGTVEDTT